MGFARAGLQDTHRPDHEQARWFGSQQRYCSPEGHRGGLLMTTAVPPVSYLTLLLDVRQSIAWDEPGPTPSGAAENLIKDVSTLHKVLAPRLRPEQTREVFSRIASMLSEVLPTLISKVPIHTLTKTGKERCDCKPPITCKRCTHSTHGVCVRVASWVPAACPQMSGTSFSSCEGCAPSVTLRRPSQRPSPEEASTARAARCQAPLCVGARRSTPWRSG